MKKFGPIRYQRGIAVSLVVSTLMPLLMVMTRENVEFFDSTTESVVRTSSCLCNGVSEKFIDTFYISGLPGLTWNVSFKPVDPQLISVSEVVGGYKVVISSSYRKAYEISLVSSKNEYITLTGGNCGASIPIIQGLNTLCLSSNGTYSIQSQDNYTFSISSGGTLTNLGQNRVEINWGSTAGTYTITAANTTNPCIPDLKLDVTIGSAYTGVLACKNQVNIGLDSTCESKVLLSDVFIGQNTVGTALALVLKLKDGTIVPNNVLSKEHIGKEIVAHIVDGCGNNSCWGNVLLEDKMAPAIICSDSIEMECFNLQINSAIVAAEDCSNYTIHQIGGDERTNLDCDPKYLARITRNFQARDQFGNTSAVCTVVMEIKRFPLDSVTFPTDLKDNISVDCNTLVSGTILPTLSGYPKINHLVLDKSNYPECNLLISYADQIIKLPTKTKIIRTWEILEPHCNVMNRRSHKQLIEVSDRVAPVIAKCIDNISITTDAHQCLGIFKLPTITASAISDNCSSGFIHQIVINNVGTKNAGEAIALPIGDYAAQYIVSDESGNTATCNFSINVSDKTPPVAICKEFVVMSLSAGGGYITSAMINNGSKDECSLTSVLIRRMSDSTDRPFRDTIHVTCSDVEKPFMVMLQATDQAGNKNTCMTTLTVQDKSIPILDVPNDRIITCAQWSANKDLKTYGEAIAFDQCNFTLEETVRYNLNSCQVGTIVRTFTVKDASHTVVKTQTITVQNSTLADFSTIVAPRDTILTGMCNMKSLHPDSLTKYGRAYGRPIVPINSCVNLGITYKDEIYTVQSPANQNCFKVIRIWKIINWCEAPGNVYELKQTIAVENNIPPSITTPRNDTLFHTENCNAGDFSLSASGSDDCTPDDLLSWSWKVENQNNMTISNGTAQGKNFNLVRSLPAGNYTFIWTLRDGCGNLKEATHKFRIKYSKGASFFVVDTVAVALAPNDTTNSACITAKPLVQSASHACGLSVKYSFSATNPNQDTICLDCKDLGYRAVTVYAHDANGVVTSARTIVHVQDNNKIRNCSNTNECVTWPRDTTINACVPNIRPQDIRSVPIIDPNCNCTSTTTTFSDRPIASNAGECTVIERTHFVTFRCNGIITTFSEVQRINRRNATSPTLVCPQNRITTRSTSNCAATVTVQGPTVSNTTCHTGLTTTYRIGTNPIQTGSSFTSSFNVGNTAVVFIVTDACGNSSTCTVNVEVTDGEAPICSVRDVTVFLNAQGQATITNPAIFDNGSRGACGPSSLTFSADRTQFNCSNLNTPVQVRLTVTGSNNQSTTCNANVMVRDTVKPTLIIRNIIKEISGINQTITVSKQELVVAASDNCGLGDTTLSRSQFTFQNLGVNNVTVTLRDAQGNETRVVAIVNIVDRVPPACNLRDVTIFVNNQGQATITDPTIFNAGLNTARFSVNRTNFTCTDIGRLNPVLVTITNDLGVSMVCDANVIVRDSIKPQLTTRNITKEITSLNQVISVTKQELIVSASDNCSLGDTTLSISEFRCQNTGPNTVTVTLRDGSGNTTTATAIVTIVDRVPPTCNLRDVTIFVNNQGQALISDASIFRAGVGASCSAMEIVSYSVDKTTFNCTNIGRSNPVKVTVSDALGISMICDANVIVRDTIKPQLTTRNITKEISSLNQIINITKQELIQSASDNCSLGDTTLSISEFRCQNAGPNTVTVTLRDSSGNTTTATAIVTIVDRVPPTCNLRDVTIFVNNQGQALINDASIFRAGDGASCSGMSLVSYTVDKTTFNCGDIGRSNPVKVTVRDALGNSMICDANVTVRDTLAPLVTPKNFELSITNNESVTIKKSDLINSIAENCSVSDTIISKNSFTCENLGSNRVTVIVVDAFGNRDTVETTVTVIDRQAPICRVRNVSILLNAQGQATIGDASVFNSGSFDACNSIPLNFSVDKTQFTCDNLGANNPVMITVTDAAGNFSTCPANVTVQDTVRPRLVVRNIQRTLSNVNATVVVNASDLIVSASDNCSIVDSANAPSIFTCANLGNNTVRVVVRDASGNTGIAEATVTILDGVAPECRLKTATVMVNGGTTTIDSSTINNGSFDPCGTIATFKVSPNTFTCNDVGVRSVTATITDAAGNITICDTTITIVDGNQLICTPKDITVSLGSNNTVTITANDVDGGSGTGCGNPVEKTISRSTFSCSDVGTPQNVILTITRPGTNQTSTCTARVTVISQGVPSFICTVEKVDVACEEYDGINIPASVPRPRIANSCGGNFKLDSVIIRLPRNCNLDTLTRTYLLFDINDNLLSTCVQSINIVNNKLLTIDSFDLPTANITLTSCADKSPEVAGGRMKVKQGVTVGCADIDISFRDTFLTNTCNDTLRRVWTAVDKCGSITPISFTQKIAIIDTFAPVITGVRDTIVFNQGDCGVQINFTNIKVADCDTRLISTNNSPQARSNNGIDPSGFYPIGIYTIALSATDACNNSSQASFRVEVRDTSSQIFACRNVERIIQPTGIVSVNARELVGYFGNNCVSTFNSRVVMSQPGLDTVSSKVYTCDNLTLVGQELLKRDTLTIQVYSGNTLLHTCSAVLTIRGGGNCQNFFALKNNVRTITEEVVPNFSISLMTGGKELVKKMTDDKGQTTINAPQGVDMMIVPFKNDDHLNGVNTLDLVQMQRHILGISKFRSPYHMIAADVNNDKKISISDIVEMRSLILGVKETFSNHTSWVAIDGDYSFASVDGALEEDYPQHLELDQINKDMDLSFVGVKIGDVDVSYTANALQKNIQQRSKAIELTLLDKNVKIGQTFELELDLSQYNAIGAELNIALAQAELLEISGKDWLSGQTANQLKLINYNAQSLNKVTLKLRALQSGKISNFIEIESGEIYDIDLKRNTVKIAWNLENIVQNELKVYPNPLHEKATIAIICDKEEDTAYLITDQLGKVVIKNTIHINKGQNLIELSRSSLNGNGVYFLIMKVGGEQKSAKIIVTE